MLMSDPSSFSSRTLYHTRALLIKVCNVIVFEADRGHIWKGANVVRLDGLHDHDVAIL